MKTKVVIVDDHQLIAKAISAIVNNFTDFEVLYEVENGQALINRINIINELPDIILMDISMPIMDGFETTLWLQEHHPHILVMALSVQDDDNALFKMINNGAKGYMHKNIHPKDLETALKTLISDKIYFPSWASQKLQTKHRVTTLNALHISEREAEFLKYVCLNLTYKEIADKMCCSPRTVEGYRDSLFIKLGIKNRVGLALFAVKFNYFNTDDFKI